MNHIPSFTLRNLDFEPQDAQLITLSLSTIPATSFFPTPSQPLTPPPPPPPPPSHAYIPLNLPTSAAATTCAPRPRRPRTETLRQGKTETITPPYPWATARRATVHSLHSLSSNDLKTINGEVQCKRCDRQYEIEYDLKEKFKEVASFISTNKDTMHHRAPDVWMNPGLPDCKFCEQKNCVRPIISKKKSINWLFLLLGQMVGCCKLAELKYFCKHTKNHRTGAKDRVLYLTYLDLCKQLVPEGPFDC